MLRAEGLRLITDEDDESVAKFNDKPDYDQELQQLRRDFHDGAISKGNYQKAVNEILTKKHTMHPSNPMAVITGELKQSMVEEMAAANIYRARAERARSHNDNLTAALYEHIASEEETHYNEFRDRYGEIP